MPELYLGLISGTSVDGVDAVLTDLTDDGCQIIAAETRAFPPALRQRVVQLIETPAVSLAELGSLDVALGRFFADCALALIGVAGRRPDEIRAIGHHGQTVYHKPVEPEPFTMQIGDPSSIAALTGITTVADFRRLDMAVGGQGAPMVPGFHSAMFGDPAEVRIVLNIGGIANVTILAPGESTLGFDTGPGNTLLDLWMRTQLGAAYDHGGKTAAAGTVVDELLEALLDEPYFGLAAPKSTGRELFNAAWLKQRLARCDQTLDPVDVLATLAELSAVTICDAVAMTGMRADRLIVCGGGAHNEHLLARLQQRAGCPVESTAAHGIAPDWVEGAAFAWLAAARLRKLGGNVPSVTGARQTVILGGVYCGTEAATSMQKADSPRGYTESEAS